jgi:hypothetical protein
MKQSIEIRVTVAENGYTVYTSNDMNRGVPGDHYVVEGSYPARVSRLIERILETELAVPGS